MEAPFVGCKQESCLDMDFKISYLIKMADFKKEGKKKCLSILHM